MSVSSCRWNIIFPDRFYYIKCNVIGPDTSLVKRSPTDRGGEEVAEGEEELRCDEGHVLVEGVLHQVGQPDVVPVAMHQQDAAEEPEPTEREVGAARRLATLPAHQTWGRRWDSQWSTLPAHQTWRRWDRQWSTLPTH